MISETHIVLDHGSGGLLSHELVVEVITKTLGDRHLGKLDDSAVLDCPPGRLAITTDSFVIDPIFFRNGNIGKVAVCGTVNDLSVSGARPLYLTLALVLEEGFPIRDLERILEAVRETAREANVHIVAGDTKVVRRGEVDKIFINTAGVGTLDPRRPHPSVHRIEPGDKVLVTGPLGDHAIHILSLREGLGFEDRVQSDCAPLNGLIAGLIETLGPDVHFMRDITRGGLGTLLNEVQGGRPWRIEIRETDLPIKRETAMAADMLGVSPLYLANEGNLCVFVPEGAASRALETIRAHPYGRNAAIVGDVVADRRGDNGDSGYSADSRSNDVDTCTHPVVMRKTDGSLDVVEFLRGAELPRLC
ncbi:MAG: hydrogenase expression/formation protein HypE [Deltaproteobacteria bacterium]|nr:hydrogenase expression/formation protein HypE [Deltaproteobacteria bacterium]